MRVKLEINTGELLSPKNLHFSGPYGTLILMKTTEGVNGLTEFEYGYCHCGCGEKTTICKYTHAKRNMKKGEPNKFIFGHQRRLLTPEYLEDKETGCWEWQRRKNDEGYGEKSVKGKMVKAHKFYYEQKYGKVPSGLELDHVVCQNTSCCNPDHLEAVTHAENSRRGKHTKLNWNMVLEIRNYTLEKTTSYLADKYGVSEPHIRKIINNKIWIEETN